MPHGCRYTVPAPHRDPSGHRPGPSPLQGGGQHRQRPGGVPEVPPAPGRLADHQQQQGEAKVMLRGIYFAETRAKAEGIRDGFSKWCRDHSHDVAGERD